MQLQVCKCSVVYVPSLSHLIAAWCEHILCFFNLHPTLIMHMQVSVLVPLASLLHLLYKSVSRSIAPIAYKCHISYIKALYYSLSIFIVLGRQACNQYMMMTSYQHGCHQVAWHLQDQ